MNVIAMVTVKTHHKGEELKNVRRLPAFVNPVGAHWGKINEIFKVYLQRMRGRVGPARRKPPRPLRPTLRVSGARWLPSKASPPLPLLLSFLLLLGTLLEGLKFSQRHRDHLSARMFVRNLMFVRLVVENTI